MTYTWYRGGEWIPTPRSPFRLEEQVDVNGGHIFTCNVSNPVSWAHQSLQLGQGCGSAPQSECSAWAGQGGGCWAIARLRSRRREDTPGLGALPQGPGL